MGCFFSVPKSSDYLVAQASRLGDAEAGEDARPTGFSLVGRVLRAKNGAWNAPYISLVPKLSWGTSLFPPS